MLNRGRTAIILAPLVALAACGSSGGHTDGQAFQDCVGHANGVRSINTKKDDLDVIAENAGDRGLKVEFAKNTAVVVVERTSDDAAKSAKGYELFGAGGDNLQTNGNVMVSWDHSPTADEKSAVEDCE